MKKEIENNRRSGERDKDAMRWRGRQTQRERYIQTHTYTAHEQARDKEGEEDRDAKGQGGQSGETAITGPLLRTFCRGTWAEPTSGGPGFRWERQSEHPQPPPYPAKPESYRQESWAWLWVPKGQSTP